MCRPMTSCLRSRPGSREPRRGARPRVTYAVRATIEAAADLDLLYGFILERDATDFTLAEAAIQA